MKALIPIIKKLQNTSSRNDKEAILTQAYKEGHVTLFKLLKYAYDPFITFGVAEKSVASADYSSSKNDNITFQEFEVLLLQFKNRELTGNAAKEAIVNLAKEKDQELWDLICKPVLLRDLRCGFTDGTTNKVLKALSKKDKSANEYIIPEFNCELAFDGSEDIITGKNILQFKLDGVRILTVCNKEEKSIIQYTRNGKENLNFPHVKKVFEELLESLPESMVFDGEMIAASFQDLMTQISRKAKVASNQTKLALFDCLPLKDFIQGVCKIPQTKRIQTLDSIIKNTVSVYTLPYVQVDLDTKEGKDEFNEFNKTAIDSGFEGIMIKKPEAPYECKRVKSWLKIKPFKTVSLPIISLEEGSGKNEGRLGAFICQGVDNDPTKEIHVNCGGGFSDAQREDFWKKGNDLIGYIIEIKADCLTKEAGSEIYSLRFPRFLGFRGTKPGEKI